MPWRMEQRMNDSRYVVIRGGTMLLGRFSRRYVYEVCDTHRSVSGYGMVVMFRGTAKECRQECVRLNMKWHKQQQAVQA